MKKRTALLAGLFFILVAAVPEGADDYIIGPRDILSLVVWGENGMSEKVEVASDGTITFFYVGKVKVAGLSVSQARDRLVGLLADGYIRNPVIILKIDEYHSKEVQIQGAIAKPGTYILTTNDTTLLKLISMAGGTGENRGNWAFVTRGEGWRELERARALAAAPTDGATAAPADGSTASAFGWGPGTAPADGTAKPDAPAPSPSPLPSSAPKSEEEVRVTVDLRGLLDRGAYSQDVRIYPGDFVLIGSKKGENPDANYVFVGGSVRTPQQIEFTEGMTALQAVIQAGGVTEVASANRTTITRIGRDGIPVVIRVRIKDIQRGKISDVSLQAGDRINVPESMF